jgi:hypothetical protein
MTVYESQEIYGREPTVNGNGLNISRHEIPQSKPTHLLVRMGTTLYRFIYCLMRLQFQLGSAQSGMGIVAAGVACMLTYDKATGEAELGGTFTCSLVPNNMQHVKCNQSPRHTTLGVKLIVAVKVVNDGSRMTGGPRISDVVDGGVVRGRPLSPRRLVCRSSFSCEQHRLCKRPTDLHSAHVCMSPARKPLDGAAGPRLGKARAVRMRRGTGTK